MAAWDVCIVQLYFCSCVDVVSTDRIDINICRTDTLWQCQPIVSRSYTCHYDSLGVPYRRRRQWPVYSQRNTVTRRQTQASTWSRINVLRLSTSDCVIVLVTSACDVVNVSTWQSSTAFMSSDSRHICCHHVGFDLSHIVPIHFNPRLASLKPTKLLSYVRL